MDKNHDLPTVGYSIYYITDDAEDELANFSHKIFVEAAGQLLIWCIENEYDKKGYIKIEKLYNEMA